MTAPLSPVEEDAELIERVARALRQCEQELRGSWTYAAAARAALQALRYGEDQLARKAWRVDAAARLETYVALRKSGLVGPPSQVDVSLIMPTLAMLDADAANDFDFDPNESGIDVDEAMRNARAALNNGEEE